MQKTGKMFLHGSRTTSFKFDGTSPVNRVDYEHKTA